MTLHLLLTTNSLRSLLRKTHRKIVTLLRNGMAKRPVDGRKMERQVGLVARRPSDRRPRSELAREVGTNQIKSP